MEKMRDLGMTGTAIGIYSSTLGEAPFTKAIETTGVAAYCCTANISTEKYPNLAKFQAEMTKRKGAKFDLGTSFINAYDAVYIEAEVLKAAKAKGGNDYYSGPKMREAILDKKAFTGGSGIITAFDVKTGGCSKPMSMVKIYAENGKYTVKTLVDWTSDQVDKIRAQ
jgi:hypothetical protein